MFGTLEVIKTKIVNFFKIETSSDITNIYLEIEDKIKKLRKEKESLAEENSLALSKANLSLSLIDESTSTAPLLIKVINEKYNNYFCTLLDKIEQIQLLLVGLENEKSKLLGNKKNSCSGIYLNDKEELLLLLRSKNDSFQPNVWCLPGGGFTGDSEEGMKREFIEETGMTILSCHLVKVISLPNINLFYFKIDKVKEGEIIVDNNEHYQYGYYKDYIWETMNLILDLKQHLKDIFSNINKIKNDSLDILTKALDSGRLNSLSFEKIKDGLSKGEFEEGYSKTYEDGTTFSKINGEWQETKNVTIPEITIVENLEVSPELIIDESESISDIIEELSQEDKIQKFNEFLKESKDLNLPVCISDFMIDFDLDKQQVQDCLNNIYFK